MSQVEITPALLADIEAKAKATTKTDGVWKSVRKFVMDEHNEYLFATPNNELSAWAAAANPAVMLAMIERIRQLEAAQCWVIVDEAGNTVNGPWFTEAEAIEDLNIYEHEPGHFDKFMTYRVARWKGGAE